MFVGCFRRWGGGKKPTFTAWMVFRCIDRVVIMVQWGMGGVFMGFCCG